MRSLAFILIFCLGTNALADEARGYLYVFGGLACVAAAGSLCMLALDDPSPTPPDFGGQVSWSYSDANPHGIPDGDSHPPSRAFSHAEVSVYSRNVAFDYSLRSPLNDSAGAQSQSFRVGYNFLKAHARPVIGLGYRKNENTSRGDALELWMPIYILVDEAKFPLTFGLQNIWVIRTKGLRWEALLTAGVKLTPSLALEATGGLFTDYPNSNLQFEIGPTLRF